MTTVPLPEGRPHAHLLDGRTTFVVGMCEVSAGFIDDEQAAVTKIPAGPAIVIHAHGHIAGRPTVLDVVIAQATRELADGFVEAIDNALDPDKQAAASAIAHDANVRAGLLPGVEKVRCPGCNSPLHGHVAIRGGCLACYPDLGPLEQAAELGEEAHR